MFLIYKKRLLKYVSVFLLLLMSIYFYTFFKISDYSRRFKILKSFRIEQINHKNSYYEVLESLSNFNYYGNISLTRNDTICQIRKLDIWDSKIKDRLKKNAVYNKCTKHPPLSYVFQNTVNINQTVNETFYSGKITKCEIAPVIRSAMKNDNYVLGEYRELNEPLIVIDDFVKIRCMAKNETSKNNSNSSINYILAYEYVHAFIQKENKKKIDSGKKINVLILIIDSVSQSSFKRALPKSFEFLKQFDNFFIFEKHHTIGTNTFQNIVPMLTNLESEVLLKSNKGEITAPFDDFPFIWKNFSEK